MIPWNYKNEKNIFIQREENGVPYLSFAALEETGLVVNGFSTRLGGASKGKYATMNFAWNKGDDPADVLENYTRMAKALGVDRDRMVASQQTHTTNVRLVTEEDAGKGVVRERDYTDVDGLITNVPDLTLATFYADCVPLYFVDPKHKAIGLSHSGRRGVGSGNAHSRIMLFHLFCCFFRSIPQTSQDKYTSVFPGKFVKQLRYQIGTGDLFPDRGISFHFGNPD